MKIALIGTHSTGKTTLGRILAEKLNELGNNVNYLNELARECPFPINEASNFKAQKWILDNQFRLENELYLPNGFLICDRATLDNFAYMQRASKDLDLYEYEKKAVEHMPSYDFVFKTKKLGLEATNDGVRSVDSDFRNEIDDLISLLLKKHKINYHELLPTIDYNIHLQFILNKIKER
ncbi:MAG: ATP-binding protein [Candidatus Magasanikbacteria bacterium]|nr:ATP-binding protein [Candidatus Magasanikbacteria bacterium]